MQLNFPIAYELEDPNLGKMEFREWVSVEIDECPVEDAPIVLTTGFRKACFQEYRKINGAFWRRDSDERPIAEWTPEASENRYMPNSVVTAIGRNTVCKMIDSGERAYDARRFNAVSLLPREKAIQQAHASAKCLVIVNGEALIRSKVEPSLIFLKGYDEDLQEAVSSWVGDPTDYVGHDEMLILPVIADDSKIERSLLSQGWELNNLPEARKGLCWLEVAEPEAFSHDADLLNFRINMRNHLDEVKWSMSIEAERGNPEAIALQEAAVKALKIDINTADDTEEVEAVARSIIALQKESRSYGVVKDRRLLDAVDAMEKTMLRWSMDKESTATPLPTP